MYVQWTSFGSTKKLSGFLTELVKCFMRVFSLCKIDNELKSLQNTFLALGYSDNFISKFITRIRTSEIPSLTRITVPW